MRLSVGSRSALLRSIAFAALAALATGCFGRFQVTRNLYDFNRTASDDRYTRWALFLAMNLAPVYPAGAAVDVFVVNPIEFWSGRNPVADTASGPERAGLQARLVPLPDGSVRLERPGTDGALILHLEPDALVARDETGGLVARISDVRGRAALVSGTLRAP
jgi:hypothetical protein